MDAREHTTILTYPHPILRTRAEEVEEITQEIQDLIDTMIGVMVEAPGIGLAANQIGALKRVIVFEQHPQGGRREPAALINPEVVIWEGEIVHNEACLSVPDFCADVRRKARVRVKGVDRDGRPVEMDAQDLKAVCLQHEIDHLDGILFIDRISSLKRALYKKSLRKRQKRG